MRAACPSLRRGSSKTWRERSAWRLRAGASALIRQIECAASVSALTNRRAHVPPCAVPRCARHRPPWGGSAPTSAARSAASCGHRLFRALEIVTVEEYLVKLIGRQRADPPRVDDARRKRVALGRLHLVAERDDALVANVQTDDERTRVLLESDVADRGADPEQPRARARRVRGGSSRRSSSGGAGT